LLYPFGSFLVGLAFGDAQRTERSRRTRYGGGGLYVDSTPGGGGPEPNQIRSSGIG